MTTRSGIIRKTHRILDNLLPWVKNNYQKGSANNIEWPATLQLLSVSNADGKSKPTLSAAQAVMPWRRDRKNLPAALPSTGPGCHPHLLSTAFGHPVRNLLADPPELLTESGWKQLLEQVRNLLTELKKLGSNANDLDGWWRWRDEAVGPEGWLRKAFTSTLAETRLPNNDVTLFDQSYVAAALFKSAVAGAILEGSSFPWSNNELKQQTRWRLLTVGIGADHYESRG
jgi:hypothetical protein